ncbi:MAG TPA: FHA domain-containing protein, partial [Pyrinomonadaceae bacterium]|nr:FHA domain-containing protein [Pyrinomonadaceae bacterium]
PGCEVLVESSPLVSRRHAYIRFENGVSILSDNGSFNGTFLNDQRITEPVKLAPGDRITLGTGGPVFVYRDSPTQRPAPVEQIAVRQAPAREPEPAVDPKTMVAQFSKRGGPASQLEAISTTSFGSKNELSIGRAASNDIHLDSLQVSKLHAKFVRSGNDFFIADTGSTNGVFVNGERITKRAVNASDNITIASFSLRLDASGNVTVFDQRARTRIDAIELYGKVGKATLVDGVSLSIGPNELVGVIGPSGAGKSTLIELLNGVRAPKGGTVVVNGHNLDRNLNALRQSLGYVPQDDIVHRELSVERTLMYVAKLRLPRDVSSKETASIVDEVLNLTGLGDRRKTPVYKLSGGERKRVSIAVELITRPSVIYLDEPTSGLDPLTAERMMSLFRELADSGRTVVMTTHSTNDIGQFDKVAMLAGGKLVYFGPPADAPKYFGVPDLRSVFERIDSGGDSGQLKQKFAQSPHFKQYVAEPLQQVASVAAGSRPKKTRLGIFGSIRQFFILSRRYFEIFRKDRLNLLILIAQAPIIAILSFFAVGATQPRDFVYFVLALVAIWFGASVSAREIVRERPIYKRERMYNLGIIPYLASKFFVIGFIVALQCLLLFLPLKLLHFLGLMSMPGEYAGIPQLWTMLLTAGVGVALGLLVSALVRTNELATTLVPLIL